MSGGGLPLKNDEYINNPDFPLFADKTEENERLIEEVEENENPAAAEIEDLPEAAVEGEDVSDTPAEESDSPSLLVPDNMFGYSDVEAEFFGRDTDDNEDEDAQDESQDAEETIDAADEETDEEITLPSDEEDEAHEDTATEQTLSKEEKKDKEPVEKPRKVDSLFDFIELFVFTLAAVFIITSFFFRYSTVEGSSMMNTLENGEKLILSSFLYTPEPGDVVVVQDRSTELKDPIVKRVIAVGGQTVKVTRTTIYVDGVALDEDYVYTGDYYNPITGGRDYYYDVEPCEALIDNVVGYERNSYYEILVPDGEIFVMGDHRNNSKDSRSIGTMHEDAIIGKVVLRFFPFDKFGKID